MSDNTNTEVTPNSAPVANDMVMGNNGLIPKNNAYDPADIFDSARAAILEDGGDVVKDANTIEGELPPDPETNDSEGGSATREKEVDPNAEVNKTEAPVDEFKPYTFEEEINGEKVSQTFKSKEELNRQLKRAVVAKSLYKQYKEMENELSELRSKTPTQDMFEQKAKDNPREVADMLFEKFMTDAEGAEYIYQKYQRYQELANMSEEERQKALKLEMADKLLKEREAIERERREFNEQQAKIQREATISRRRDIAKLEYQKVRAQFPDIAPKISGYIVNTLDLIHAQEEKLGKSIPDNVVQARIRDVIKPFIDLKKASISKKELGNSVDAQRKKAAASIQSQARASGGNPQAKSQKNDLKNLDQGDIWDTIEESVLKGKIKLRD